MTYFRLVICGVGAKVSMNPKNESNHNRNFDDHFTNISYNITEKHLLTV